MKPNNLIKGVLAASAVAACTILAFGSSAKAMDNDRKESAFNFQLGSQRTVTWPSSERENTLYNKIHLSDDGVVTISASKPKDHRGSYIDLDCYVQDMEGNTLWKCENDYSVSNGESQYNMYVGLREGDYYVVFLPETESTSDFSTTYTIRFTEKDHVEFEYNDTIGYATPIRVDDSKLRLGYFGSDGASSWERADCWKAELKKGTKYRLLFSELDNISRTTTAISLLAPDGSDVVDHNTLMYELRTHVTNDTYRYNYYDFTAKQDGYYVVRLDNYTGVQYEYFIGINSMGEETPIPSKPNDPIRIRAFVTRIYTKLLNRSGDQNGIDYWTALLVNKEKTGAEVARGFVYSNEFQNSDINDEEFILRLYRTFFDSEGDPAGRAYWLNELKKGHSRKYVLRGFAASDQFTALCDDYGIVRGTVELTDADKECNDNNLYIERAKVEGYIDRLYMTILGRGGDATGRQYWISRIMNREESAASVAMRGFFHSDEYINAHKSDEEFIKDLYRSMMGREADSGGLEYWKGQLLYGGYTRDRVITHGFGNSNEFGEILRDYGLKKLD